jgi:uncharacterized protein (DUF1501 family)
MKPKFSRRDILRIGATTLATSTVFGRLGKPLIAHAANPYVTGYKALVCINLLGGNQGFNMVVPTTQSAYGTYAASRTNLALAQNTLLPLNGQASDGNTYGFHPSCPELAALFNAKNLAIVANVGTLIQPTTVAQAQAGSVPLPPQLFSHSDQSNQWATAIPQSLNLYGWAGRIADVLIQNSVSTQLGFNISVIGTGNYWQQGANTLPYSIGSSSPPAPVFQEPLQTGPRPTAMLALQQQAASDSSPFVNAYQSVVASAATKESVLDNALKAAGSLTTQFPTTSNDGALTGNGQFAAQLQQVAQVIKAQSQIGDARQMFFVQLQGFDTHNGELATQSALLGALSQVMNAFWLAMGEINMTQNVTVFTMSEFGRTLTSNGGSATGTGAAGSDHGWGSHAIIQGGAVTGGFYGTMPSLQVGGPDDFNNGRLVPTTSTDQLAATLASWFGIAAGDIATLFPNLKNFSMGNLGFMAS